MTNYPPTITNPVVRLEEDDHAMIGLGRVRPVVHEIEDLVVDVVGLVRAVEEVTVVQGEGRGVEVEAGRMIDTEIGGADLLGLEVGVGAGVGNVV